MCTEKTPPCPQPGQEHDRAVVRHPSWCAGGPHCGRMLGEHVSLRRHWRSSYGVPVHVGLIQSPDDEGTARVLLSLPLDVRESLPPGLTDEEADRLSSAELRWRLEAADEWERVARG